MVTTVEQANTFFNLCYFHYADMMIATALYLRETAEQHWNRTSADVCDLCNGSADEIFEEAAQ